MNLHYNLHVVYHKLYFHLCSFIHAVETHVFICLLVCTSYKKEEFQEALLSVTSMGLSIWIAG